MRLYVQKEKLMMAKNETFFIRAYVEPLYVKLCTMFPEICLRLTNLTNNLSVYRKIIDQEGESCRQRVVTMDDSHLSRVLSLMLLAGEGYPHGG